MDQKMLNNGSAQSEKQRIHINVKEIGKIEESDNV